MKARFVYWFFSSSLLALAILLAGNPVHASDLFWSLEYGSGTEQLGYYNKKVDKNYAQATPFGPMAFRILQSEVWVADSTHGRILCFNAKGKLIKDLKIPGVPRNTLIEDFALVYGSDNTVTSVWVGDGADVSVKQISVADGKQLVKFGALGKSSGQIQQIQQMEVGPSGRLYVGDYGRQKILVFEPSGNFLRELPWQDSGFALDSQENLHLVTYTKDAGFSVAIFDRDGKAVKTVRLGLNNLQNPRLWAIDKNGGFWMTFIPQPGYRGILDLYHFTSTGDFTGKASFVNPKGMNRYLEFSLDGRQFLAEADFKAAPTGTFVINQTTFDLKK